MELAIEAIRATTGTYNITVEKGAVKGASSKDWSRIIHIGSNHAPEGVSIKLEAVFEMMMRKLVTPVTAPEQH